MDLVPSDKEKGLQTPIWKHYESLLLKADCKVSAAPTMGPSVSWQLGSGRVNHGNGQGRGVFEPCGYLPLFPSLLLPES